MATFSTSFTSKTSPELVSLSPHYNPTKRLKVSLHRPHNRERRTNIGGFGTRIRAVWREESNVLDDKDKELAAKLNGGYRNGSIGGYTNGSVKGENQKNGNLAKYVKGNGNGSKAAAIEVEAVKTPEVISKRKTVEEIGQEEAWFKRKEQDQVEV